VFPHGNAHGHHHEDEEQRSETDEPRQNRAQSRERRAPGIGRRLGARQVADQRIQFTVGPGREGGAEPLLELLGGQPALARGVAEALRGLVAVAVGGSDRVLGSDGVVLEDRR
jgi:hypothetical protein